MNLMYDGKMLVDLAAVMPPIMEMRIMFITIYTRKNSLPCFATKRALKQQGLTFTTHCVDDDPQLEQSLLSQGYEEFPVVITDNLSWSGFRPDMINRLRLHGQVVNSR